MNRRRQSLVAAYARAVRQGRLRWAWRAGWRALELRRGRRPGAPLFATLAVTYRCNYRCFMCDLPGRARQDPTTEELLVRLDGLRRRGVLAVGITGGEPLLHPGLFEVLAAARRHGLLVHLNSNGSRLTRDRCAELLAAGLHSINVSLDGATAGTHDELRGVPGSFAQIRSTVAELVQRRTGSSPRLQLVMALSRRNLHEVQEFGAVGEHWRVDAVSFLPVHSFVAAQEPLTAAEAQNLRQRLAEVRGLDNSAAYVAGIPAFLAGEEMPTSCSAPASHVALDPDGQSYPCVPLMTLARGGAPDGQARSPTAADQQEVCRRCWWNCHRELDASLGLLPRTAPVSSG